MVQCWHQVSIVTDNCSCDWMRGRSSFHSAIYLKQTVMFCLVRLKPKSILTLFRSNQRISFRWFENLVRLVDLFLVCCEFFFAEDFEQNWTISNDNFPLCLLLLGPSAPKTYSIREPSVDSFSKLTLSLITGPICPSGFLHRDSLVSFE